jgi:hypothetical protein
MGQRHHPSKVPLGARPGRSTQFDERHRATKSTITPGNAPQPAHGDTGVKAANDSLPTQHAQLIRWVPVIVPLFAVLLALDTYLLLGASL